MNKKENQKSQLERRYLAKEIKWKIKEINYNIRRTLRNLKIYDWHLERLHKKQRAKRGWADDDIYSIDWWFQNVFVDMLQNFQIRTHGCPMEDFEEVDTFPKGWVKLALDEIKKETLEYEYNCFTVEDINEMIKDMDDFIKWKLIIKRIIFYLNESNEDKCSRKNKYFDIWYANCFSETDEEVTQKDLDKQAALTDKWRETEDQIAKYRQDCAKQAFNLIGKYFFNLWD